MRPARSTGSAASLRVFFLTTGVLWTLVIIASLIWSFSVSRSNVLELARIQAGIAHDKDLLYRRWNAGHGGVYVFVTAQTPPNPNLAHLPERDLETTTGRRLTLINPAYMTRQVNEMAQLQSEVYGHITSLRPLRPDNAPDPWETRALQAFERGEREVVSLESFSGAEHLRLMRPLVTEQACLMCHAGQGYAVGDIRGGISVSVPMAPLAAIAHRNRTVIVFVHLLSWLFGIGFIVLGGRRLVRAERQRRATEDALYHERETLRLLYESSPDAVAVIGRDYRIVYANQRVQDLTDVPLDALLEKPCHQGIVGSPVPCDGCRLPEVFERGRPVGRIKRETSVAGRENWLWQQWYPVRGADGCVESVVEIARDVSDLKRAEAELQRHASQLEEANHIKDLFSDIMSHDLLGPVTAAHYFLEHLKGPERDPGRLQVIQTIGRNLSKLVRMIQNASVYSKLKETRQIDVKVEDLGEIVREVRADLEPLAQAAGIAVEGPPEGRFPAPVNPIFTNVVANLFGNALKHAAAGKRVALGIADGGSEWILSVKDWGEGIPDESKKSVFNRFERLNKEGVKGTGLGLAIARRIVELHGGRIWVENNPEGGSVFLVALRKKAATNA